MQLVPRVVIAFGFMLAAIISVAYFDLKEQTHTLRGTTEFVLDDFDRSLTKEELYASLSTVAARNSVNIYKVSFGTDRTDRQFFEFVGNPERQKVLAEDGKYVTFDPQLRTTFKPASSITTQDIRGRYAIDGTEAAKIDSFSDLRSLGFNVAIWDDDYARLLWDSLSRSQLLTVFIVVVLCCALVVGYTALSSTKDYAVKQLHGFARTRIALEGLAETLITCVATAAAVGVATVVYLWVYNDFARFGSFSRTLLTTFGFLALLLTLVRTAATAIAISLPNNSGRYLKGDRPDSTLIKFAYAGKFTVLAATLLLAIGGLHALARTPDMARAADRWKHTAEYLAISYSTGLATEDGPEKRQLDARIRNLFASFEQRGESILVASQDVRSSASGSPDERLIDLVVDNNYLRENCVVDLQNTCVRDVQTADLEMTLLLPASMKGSEDDIKQSYASFVAFQQRIQGTPVAARDITARISYVKDDQDLFSYRAATALTGAFTRDPVLLVTDASTRLLSDDFYSAKSSSAEALFIGASSLEDELKQTGLDSAMQYYYSIKSQSMQEISDFESASRNQLIGLAITMIASAITSAFLAAIYCSRNRKMIYLETIHGYPFFRRHQKISAGLILGYTATFAGITVSNPSILAGKYGAVTVALIVADLLVTTGFVATYESRLHASWLKRA